MMLWSRWWQKIKQHWWIVVIFAALAVIMLIFAVSLINGTGFDGYYTILIARTTGGTAPPTVTRTEGYQRGKTLWDWMQLLIIPVVLTVGGFLFSRARDEIDRTIASDKQREDMLQAYLDKLSELLLEEDLRESAPNDKVRYVARARTLTVLRRLDPVRKGSLLQFLYESSLIRKDVGNGIIDLKGVDLSGADLSRTNLRRIKLDETNLRKANLRETDLRGADLRGADLSEADLGGADLSEADLSEADLRGTNLIGALTTGINMSRANL